MPGCLFLSDDFGVTSPQLLGRAQTSIRVPSRPMLSAGQLEELEKDIHEMHRMGGDPTLTWRIPQIMDIYNNGAPNTLGSLPTSLQRVLPSVTPVTLELRQEDYFQFKANLAK